MSEWFAIASTLERNLFSNEFAIWRKVRLVLAACCVAAGCTSRGTDRFLDHPILSWAPFTQTDIDSLNPVFVPEQRSNRYSVRNCYTLAQERTDVLDRREFNDDDLAIIFDKVYTGCVTDEAR
jgi:hypothetical protein